VIGRTIAHYEVLSLLGSGGMGEVYLALDTKLGRRLALKLLPDSLAGDSQRTRLFEKEARAASALNHPNIITVYEIGQLEDRHYLAMEYVDGATLREHIYRQQTPLLTLLKYLQQVAEGLTKAHAAGIVHRDLKPDNIMITRDGYAKILDFGLAKLIEQPTVAQFSDSSDVSTALLMPQSLPGVVIGTLGYMSPEQAQGKTSEIDHRSDIFSFGCILYEAATGKRPFEGTDAIDVLHKIVHAPTPQIRDVIPNSPPDLERIARRCLAKNRDKRYQLIKDVVIELEELQQYLKDEPAFAWMETGTTGTTEPRSDTVEVATQPTVAVSKTGEYRKFIFGSIVLIVVMVAGITVYKYLARDGPQGAGASFKATPLATAQGAERNVSFSPDGKQVAYVWTGEKSDNFDVYVKIIGAGEPLRLTTNTAREMSPVFSPDGRYIAFLRDSPDPLNRGLYLVPALGRGAERKLADFSGWPGSNLLQQAVDWSPDGRTIAMNDKIADDDDWSIFLIAVETGERRRLTRNSPGLNNDVYIAFSPDGSRVAFARAKIFGGDIYTVSVAGGEPVRVTYDDAPIYGLAWTADGSSIVYASERDGSNAKLWRVAATGGTPTPIATGSENIRELAIARQGNRLAYAQTNSETDIYRLELTGQAGAKRDSGARVDLISSTRREHAAEFSPDGRRIAFRSDRSGNYEIWVCDSEGKNPTQLTHFDGPRANDPKWSADGRWIAFSSGAGGNADVYVISAEGGTPRRLTTDDRFADTSPSWSGDGQWIYFTSTRSGTSDVWKMPVAGGEAVQVTYHGGFDPVESPDGRTVYYNKSDTEVWQVSTAGGDERLLFKGSIDQFSWAVAPRGIYFFSYLTPSSRSPYALNFFDFATRKIRRIANLDGHRPDFQVGGLSVSPDERWVIYTQRDRLEYDLLLVEGFH
jgi:Tol biopolymer transport system component/predicted Ser/Thr protein kinase